MNLRDLQYLVAVAETNHFGKAAERCCVSQPTLSGQIKKLEDELGITLFERTNRSVEITPVGETLLQPALRIMEQVERIRQLARSHSDPLVGPLRLGAILTISPYLIPLILRPLKQQHPQMRLVLSEEMTDTLTARLHNHEIDAALLATRVEDRGLQAIPLYDEPFWMAYPKTRAPAADKNISRRELEKTDLLLLSDGHCLADQAMSVCRIHNRDKQGEMADLRAASLETLLQLVAADMGCTMVPALALQGSWSRDKAIVMRKLEFPDAHRRVSIVYRKSFPRPEAIEVLADTIRQHLPERVTRAGV
ncbi:MAG: LysR substrate-binding domain-containing protein [Thiogranum sp.]